MSVEGIIVGVSGVELAPLQCIGRRADHGQAGSESEFTASTLNSLPRKLNCDEEEAGVR